MVIRKGGDDNQKTDKVEETLDGYQKEKQKRQQRNVN